MRKKGKAEAGKPPNEKWKTVEAVFVVSLVVIFLSLTLLTSDNTNFTFDEPNYIAGGVLLLEKGIFNVPNAPILPAYLAGILPVSMGIRIPSYNTTVPLEPDNLNENTAFKSNLSWQQIRFASRLPFIIIGALVLLLVYTWSRSLFGWKAGVFSMSLFAFEPLILGSTPQALSDILLTATVMASLYFFWRHLKTETRFDFAASGVFAGLAIATKPTGYFLFMIFLIAFIAKKPDVFRALKKTLSLFLISLLVIFVLYQFRFDPIYPKGIDYLKTVHAEKFGSDNFVATAFRNVVSNPDLERLVTKTPLPLGSYIYTFFGYYAYVDAKTVYFDGQIRDAPFYYMGALLLAKATPFFLILAALGIWHFWRKAMLDEKLALILPLAIFFIILSSGMLRAAGSVRHLLPLLPLLAVVSGSLILAEGKMQKIFLALLGMQIIISLLVFPNYYSYVSLPNGERLIAGFDIDSGQADGQVWEYMIRNGIKQPKYAFSGSVNPNLYGYNFTILASTFNRDGSCGKTSGTIAVSTTALVGYTLKNPDCYNWLENYEPVKKIGNAVYIYKIE